MFVRSLKCSLEPARNRFCLMAGGRGCGSLYSPVMHHIRSPQSPVAFKYDPFLPNTKCCVFLSLGLALHSSAFTSGKRRLCTCLPVKGGLFLAGVLGVGMRQEDAYDGQLGPERSQWVSQSLQSRSSVLRRPVCAGELSEVREVGL